ncbi:hypothetical protein TWF506_008896 [Arthrobotrys conoides]|uniref:Uncharacterized protein n=1 Tax=Arthrobotrys conoides TaxID=74498 RepID=A0AAN8RX49_9PEZI
MTYPPNPVILLILLLVENAVCVLVKFTKGIELPSKQYERIEGGSKTYSIHPRRTWDPEGGKQSNCIKISDIYEPGKANERIVQIDVDQASHDTTSGAVHPYTRSSTALAFYADSTNFSTTPTIIILPEMADMQLRLCEDRRTEEDCQYQEFDLGGLGYPWPQRILSFREVFPAQHFHKTAGADSLPSWDLESVLDGTSKPDFIDTEGCNTENAIDLSNLKLDDPLPHSGPEFPHEIIEGLEQELTEYVDPDWEAFVYKPDCGGIGIVGSRVLPPRVSDVWYGMPPYNFLLSRGPDTIIETNNLLGCDSQGHYIKWIEGEHTNYRRNLLKRIMLADMKMSEAVQDLEALYDVNFLGNVKARDISRSIWGDENIERPGVK